MPADAPPSDAGARTGPRAGPHAGRRVVVTGAQGLLGRRVVAELLALPEVEAVLGVGRSPRQDAEFTHTVTSRRGQVPAPVPEDLVAAARDTRYVYVATDLTDGAATTNLFDRFGPTAVVHSAAALRDSSWEDLIDSNIHATIGVVAAAARVGRPRFVLVSSGAVYGTSTDQLPLREDGPAQPADPYAVTKRTAEDVVRIAGAQHRLPVVSARVFNLLGPGLQERHLPGHLAAHLVRARHSPDVRISLGPLQATRDLVDVRDAAGGLVLLALHDESPPVVNIASGVETSMEVLVARLTELAGSPPLDVDRSEARVNGVSRSVADVRALRALGHRCRHSLEESLQSMLDYYERL